jgi:hypothetical protein
MLWVDAEIMGIVIPGDNVSSAVKIRDGAKEQQVIQQFGCQTEQNAVSAINSESRQSIWRLFAFDGWESELPNRSSPI